MQPTKTRPVFKILAWTFFVIIPGIAFLTTILIPENPAQVAAGSAKDAACLTDLQCAGDKFLSTANAYCRPLLLEQAKAIAKWDYQIEEVGFTNSILDKFRWADDTKTQLIYVGDKAKFQNGFGAWKHVGYQCIFDVASKKPIAALFDNTD